MTRCSLSSSSSRGKEELLVVGNIENFKEIDCVDETATLDDIDDSEVAGYLLDKEETRLKEIAWESIYGGDYNMQQATQVNMKQNENIGTASQVKRVACQNTKASAADKIDISEEIDYLEIRSCLASQKLTDGRHDIRKVKRKKNLNRKAAFRYFKKRFGSDSNFVALARLFDYLEEEAMKDVGD